MNVFIGGDKHLHIGRYALSLSCLKWHEDQIKTIRPDFVVYTGDDMHNHAILRAELLEEYKKHIIEITKICPVYYIVGNHDCYKPNSIKYHAFQVFKDIPNFNVIDEITNINDFTFVPYLYNIDDFPKKTGKICFAHQVFAKADFGYIRIESGIDPDSISADVIISGHVHKKQEYGKVIYPGSVYSYEQSDLNQSKNVMLFNTETYERTYIETPFPQWKELSYNFAITNCSDIINDIITYVSDRNKENVYVLKITGNKEEVASFSNSKDIKMLRSSYNIKIYPIYVNKDKIDRSIKAHSAKDIIDEYIKTIYTGNINKDILYKKAIEIYEKVV